MLIIIFQIQVELEFETISIDSTSGKLLGTAVQIVAELFTISTFSVVDAAKSYYGM